MNIKITTYEQKIVAIKGLRMVAKNFHAMEDGVFAADSFSLRGAKEVFDRIDQGDTPIIRFAIGGDVNREVALAIFKAHGVTAEIVEITVEVTVSLLKRLRDAVSPNVAQSNWDLWDAVDDLLQEADR